MRTAQFAKTAVHTRLIDLGVGFRQCQLVLMCRFASIAKLAGEQLGPYIANLVPKLYRYQYDPNARVRDSMSHIWRALVAEPKKTVDQHFAAILQELLKVICCFLKS